VNLAEIEALEDTWRWREPRLRDQELFYAWEPYDIESFLSLLDIAIPKMHIPLFGRGSFLDVGCGIGTKCLLAEQRGLNAEGIERVPEYVAEARRLSVKVAEIDCRDWNGYGNPWGIVFMNGPFRDVGLQSAFDAWLAKKLRRGTVLIAVNTAVVPEDWETIHRNEDELQAIMVKP
jgi:SAM-dependent methyltransferase